MEPSMRYTYIVYRSEQRKERYAAETDITPTIRNLEGIVTYKVYDRETDKTHYFRYGYLDKFDSEMFWYWVQTLKGNTIDV